MKRKNSQDTDPPNPDRVVAPEILDSAKRGVNASKRGIESERARGAKCVVCGAEATADAAEHLCWVCRRLKISAWRDVEQQMPAQE